MATAQFGSVGAHQKINNTEGEFTGVLELGDYFGASTASLGDLNGDGVIDLAVGSGWVFGGLFGSDALWVLFLNPDGTVGAHRKIDDTEGGFAGILVPADQFGSSMAAMGDLNGDGVTDLAVGASGDADGGSDRGAVWVLFLNADGTVKSHQKISDTEGGFAGVLAQGGLFGSSMVSLGDLNGDGVTDLAVGAKSGAAGGNRRGVVWVLFLNVDGTVNAHQRISYTGRWVHGSARCGRRIWQLPRLAGRSQRRRCD